MNIKEYSDIANIVTSVATVLIAMISTIVAIFVHKWRRESTKVENLRILNQDFRHYNELIINNNQLQELELKKHRWGNLKKDQIVLMYQYFICFNTVRSCFEMWKNKAIDEMFFESTFNNIANLTYGDRDFINQHVLPRGYARELREEINKRWDTIRTNGTLNSD